MSQAHRRQLGSGLSGGSRNGGPLWPKRALGSRGRQGGALGREGARVRREGGAMGAPTLRVDGEVPELYYLDRTHGNKLRHD